LGYQFQGQLTKPSHCRTGAVYRLEDPARPMDRAAPFFARVTTANLDSTKQYMGAAC